MARRYPGQSCATCREIEQEDGIEPECRDGSGCPILIDRFGTLERRAIAIRNALITSGGLLGPDTILKRYEADDTDIDLIMVIEDAQAKLNEADRQASRCRETPE